MLLVRFYVNVYYVIVCAWAFFYLFSGFTSTANIPWADCGAMELNTIGCYSPRELERCNVSHDGLSDVNVQYAVFVYRTTRLSPTPTTTAPAWTTRSSAASLVSPPRTPLLRRWRSATVSSLTSQSSFLNCTNGSTKI